MSADCRKYKRSESASIIRHNDKEERLKHEHKNQHIDKSMTYLNDDFIGMSYREKYNKFKFKINDLDKTTNKNIRKNRVELVTVECHVPYEMFLEEHDDFIEKDDKSKENSYPKCRAFMTQVYNYVKDWLGDENIISADVHFDEIHAYLDSRDKQVKLSMPHIHITAIPCIEGRLCAKQIYTKAAFTKLNKDIDTIAHNMGYEFLTGKSPGKLTVEQLKAMSNKEMAVLKKEYDRLTTQIKGKIEDVAIYDKEIKNIKNTIKELEAQKNKLEHNIDNLGLELADTITYKEQLEEEVGELDEIRKIKNLPQPTQQQQLTYEIRIGDDGRKRAKVKHKEEEQEI